MLVLQSSLDAGQRYSLTKTLDIICRVWNMSLTIPNLVPQRPFCYLNFNSVAKLQKFGNETYDAHVLASSKTYRKKNKPKKWIPNPLRYMSF